MTSLNAAQPTIQVEGDTDFLGVLVKGCEKGTWNVHVAPNAMIYLHSSVGIEAAMKLFVWDDLGRKNGLLVKTTSNINGRVVGVVVRNN